MLYYLVMFRSSVFHYLDFMLLKNNITNNQIPRAERFYLLNSLTWKVCFNIQIHLLWVIYFIYNYSCSFKTVIIKYNLVFAIYFCYFDTHPLKMTLKVFCGRKLSYGGGGGVFNNVTHGGTSSYGGAIS